MRAPYSPLRKPQSPRTGLADTTVLIVRHAEKPAEGTDLTPAGAARAAWYPTYFRDLRLGGAPVHISHIFATADSKGSHRERLTMGPLAKQLGVTIDLRFKNKEVGELAEALRTKSYGSTVLICWHHGRIPELLTDLGADPAKLLPAAKWPAETFDWLIELRYDHAGKLASEKRVVEDKVGG